MQLRVWSLFMGVALSLSLGIPWRIPGRALTGTGTPPARSLRAIQTETGWTGGGLSQVVGTLLGGSDREQALAIAVDGMGNIYLTGWTRSPDFPVSRAYDSSLSGGSDAFLAKYAPDGVTLVYSTYLGGSGLDAGQALGFTPQGDLVVVGRTTSQDFPVVGTPFQGVHGGGVYDGFVALLDDATGVPLATTYLGATGWDELNAVEVAAGGEVFVAGFTASPDLHLVNPVQIYQGRGDGFLARLTPGLDQLTHSTYLGGGERDTVRALALVGKNQVALTGTTSSADFPVSQPWQSQCGGCPLQTDAFYMVLATDGRGVSNSTFLGGGARKMGLPCRRMARGMCFWPAEPHPRTSRPGRRISLAGPATGTPCW